MPKYLQQQPGNTLRGGLCSGMWSLVYHTRVAEPRQQPRQATKYGSQAHREAIAASIRRKWEDPEYRTKVSLTSCHSAQRTGASRCRAADLEQACGLLTAAIGTCSCVI